MASQEEDNKVECKTNVNKDQERNHIVVYKKYEWILNNKNESYAKKIESLIEVWNSIGQCNLTNTDLQYIVQIIDWAKLHTLNIVLTGEWKKLKDQYQERLLQEVKTTQSELTKVNSAFHTRCQKLADVINNPWSDPTLEVLVRTPDAEIGPKEIEFFCAETAYLTSVRLKKLCESQCEDLALNLVKAFMKCYRLSQTEAFNLNATETQIWFIFDIYVALLFKFKETEKLLEILKGLSLDEGSNLIKRFAKKRVKISKVWKNCQKIAILASRVYISSAIIKPIEETKDILRCMLTTYASLNGNESYLKDLMDSSRTIIRLAPTAGPIYIFCDVFQEHFGLSIKGFIIELYIRALTTDMNALESQKTENESDKLLETTKRLARGFCKLADLLQDNVHVSRECVLTAFSLEPTTQRLNMIEQSAKSCGFEVLDTGQDTWACKLHPPVLPSDDLVWMCPSCGDWMCKPQLDVTRKTNTALNEALTEEKLGITHELCDDLVVLLSSPRYQVLSWLLDWPDLHRLCRMYLDDQERTKNLVTDLKFVDIDYSMFIGIKKEPLDDYAGIERGYEQYLDQDFMSDDQVSTISEDTASQDSRPYSLGSDGCGETQFSLPPHLTPQPKSDPNTLKSLRAYRPNLKRSRPNQTEINNVPEKVFKVSDNFDFAIPSSSKYVQPPPQGYSQLQTAPLSKNLKKQSDNFKIQLPSTTSQKQETHSKNGLVATLRQTGGQQVATQSTILHPDTKASHSTPINTTAHGIRKSSTTPPPINLVTPTPITLAAETKCPSDPLITMETEAKPTTTEPCPKLTTVGPPLTTCPLKVTQVRKIPHTTLELELPIPPVLEVPIPQATEAISPTSKEPPILLRAPTPSDLVEADTIQSPSSPQAVDMPCLELLPPTITPITCLEPPLLTTAIMPILEPPQIPPVAMELPPTLPTVVTQSIKSVKMSAVVTKSHRSATLDTPSLGPPKLTLEPPILTPTVHLKRLVFPPSMPPKLTLAPPLIEPTLNPHIKHAATKKIICKPNKSFSLSISLKDNLVKTSPIRIRIRCNDSELSEPELEFLEQNLNHSKGKKRSKRRRQTPLIRSIHKDRYESYPDTGSDSQMEDDNYSEKSYIDLFKRSRKRRNPRSNDKYNKIKRRSVREVRKTANKTDSNTNQRRELKVILERLDFDKYLSTKRCDTPHTNCENCAGATPKYLLQNGTIPRAFNPRVILERLPLNNTAYVRAVLRNVPGLNDLDLVQPGNVDQIVNVVQVAGGRPTSQVQSSNTQTSTQVTPHIQRIGQPRVDKPDAVPPDSTATSEAPTVTTVASSAPAKPATTQPSTLINILSQQIIRPGQSNCVRTRPSPLINILSQQIVKPPQIINKVAQITTETPQANNVAKSTTEQPALTTPLTIKTSTTAVKGVVGSAPPPGTILQFICKSSLPKFQQAFGKTVYNSEGADASSTSTSQSTTTIIDAATGKKIQPAVKNHTTVNLQPIQGSVIYTRQMPVGQTINLIPPGRGQVFRIATSNPEQLSLVKETVIHSKMSALLAAALQGKKAAESTAEGGETNQNDEKRPTLVQGARIVKPVLQIPSNVIRTNAAPPANLSSTTLEQLREFDMVYKQIKERSTTSTTADGVAQEEGATSAPQTQRISVTYVNQGQKYTQLSPVVVVSTYCNVQPAASPALSVTSQGSSSPCVTPAPTPTLPKVSSRSSKGKTVKSTTTTASKASPIPKPQQKPQEDEHTTQRIFDILAEYAEQLRNSPDLNNKPAPRRRSNPPTNPSHNSKRKKSSGGKKSGSTTSMLSDAELDDQRTMESEDSSCGLVPLSKDDDAGAAQTPTESNESTSSQRLILTESTGTTSTPTRNLIITDSSSVGEALKIPNTAVLMPGNYIMPVSMVKGGQQIAVMSGGSKILATVPARSGGPNMLLFQSFLNQNRKVGVPTVKYSTIQSLSGISSQSLAGVSAQPPVILPSNSHNLTAVTLGQPLTIKKLDDASENKMNTELLLTIAPSRVEDTTSDSGTLQPDSSTGVNNNSVIDGVTVLQSVEKHNKTIPVATPVIAQSCAVVKTQTGNHVNQDIITLNLEPESSKDDLPKRSERVQSVLVATSNGPMLTQHSAKFRKATETQNAEEHKEDYIHNGEKTQAEPKTYQTTYFQHKIKKISATQPRLDRELHQLCLQRKQAAIERELRLQKSLSEECEDLGVDEPSTSDLFPEADLLFDTNHSPSYDQTSQDIKRTQDAKEKSSTITLFSDDDNSSSLRTDFLFEPVEYQTETDYAQEQQLTNGQAGNESGSSCEDSTLLQNCANMSDVTLNSPVSPDFVESTPAMNKYKFKYSNRKKSERHKAVAPVAATTAIAVSNEAWAAEVSSSEDTTGSTELNVEQCEKRHTCEEDDTSYKVVRVRVLNDESCEDVHSEEDVDSHSGRGARKSVKKMCSCCNGNADGMRKRPSSRPEQPALHKKAFFAKKR